MTGATDAVDTANSIIDTVQSIANNPLIGLIGLVFPQANAVIDVVRRYESTIDKAQPIIRKAVEVGEPVFEKAIEQLPKLGEVVGEIAALMPSVKDPKVAVENIVRVLGGVGRMTPEQERRWMELATPPNDSQFGGG